MSVQQGSGATFRVPSRDPSAASECGSLACEAWGVVSTPAAVVGLAAIGLAVFLGFAYLRDARESCREERRRVGDERDAFVRFSERVAGLEATQTDVSSSALDGPMVGVRRGGGVDGPSDVGITRAVDAYRNTVMSLPHYTEEYDESVAESLAAELGADAARRLVGGGTLSPELKSALVTRSRHAAQQRATLVDAIDDELDALAAADEELTTLDRRRERLNAHLDGVRNDARTGAEIDVFQRLETLEQQCDEAVANRQEWLRNPPMPTGFEADDSPTFHGYLFGPLPETDYPVLAAFSELAERVRADRDRLVSRIARGP
ncbi:hypothetical protein JCM17823_25760 [Halorubrum gandharaense]